MKYLIKNLLIFTLLSICTNTYAQSNLLDSEILEALDSRAKSFCETVDIIGKSKKLNAGAEIEAGVIVSILKALNINFKTGVGASSEEWENVIQEQLGSLKSKELDCRLEYLTVVINSTSINIDMPKSVGDSEIVEIREHQWIVAPDGRGVALDYFHKINFPETHANVGVPVVIIEVEFPLDVANKKTAKYYFWKDALKITNNSFTVMLIKGGKKRTHEFAKITWKATWVKNK